MTVVLFFNNNWKRLILRKKYCHNKSDKNSRHATMIEAEKSKI